MKISKSEIRNSKQYLNPNATNIKYYSVWNFEFGICFGFRNSYFGFYYTAGADTSWYHCDALGSPRKMTNESGVVVWTGAYQPFGEMLAGAGNVHGFTPLERISLLTGQAGKELNSESDLNYFCQRYYDSQIGRFMTLESVDQKGGSPYAYCRNNPLKSVDPMGMWDQPLVERIPFNFSSD